MSQYAVVKLMLYMFVLTSSFFASIAQAKQAMPLNNIEQIYHLNSAKQGSGFIAVPADFTDDELSIKRLITSVRSASSSIQPDFNRATRYAFVIEVENRSQTAKWFVQVNHFLIDQIDLYVQNNEGLSKTVIQSTSLSSTIYQKNILGRAIPVNLSKDASSKIVIILTANDIRRPVYLGLMSDFKYGAWSDTMDFVFIVAIGIVLCIILLSISCFLLVHDQTFLWFAISTSLILTLSLVRSPFGIVAFGPAEGFYDWLWIVIGFMQISILMLVKSFLSIQSNSKTGKLFYSVIGVSLVAIALSYLLFNEHNVMLFSVTTLLVIILVIAIGMIKALKSGAIYTIFMLSWLPIAYTIGHTIYLQVSRPEQYEVTLSYYNVQGPYFQVIHFFIQFIAMVLRILDIKKQKLAAEAQSTAKTNFLAELSHDLKQPVDAMGLMLGLLEDEPDSKKSQSLISKLKRLHLSMREVFAALTDYTQLESGKLKVRPELVSLKELFAELYLEHELAFKQKHIHLNLRSLDKTLLTDRTLVKRILRNLLSNAINYTDKGKVLLSARQCKGGILLQVWDTGRGISPDKQKTIFDMYSQGMHDEKNQHGNGVGLASVKHIASLLGYKIHLRSHINKGSVFCLTIPKSSVKSENINIIDSARTGLSHD